MAHDLNQADGGRRSEEAIGGARGEKTGGYPAGPKPATGVPPVPQGLRKPRTPSTAQNPRSQS